jgi:hypothetical protein
VISDAVRLLKLFHSDFPEFQVSTFPSAPIEVLFDRDVTPKLQPLVYPPFFPELRDRFIMRSGGPFTTAHISDTPGATSTYEVPGEGTCTVSDKTWDHRFSGTKISNQPDQTASFTGAIVTTTVSVTIPCAEGKKLTFSREFSLSLTPSFESSNWKLYAYNMTAGSGVRFVA